MAQTDARITINLPVEVYEPLKRTCAALGVSMSSMVRDLLENAVPMLVVLEDAATAIQTAPEKHREMILALAEEMAGVKADALHVVEKVTEIGRSDDPRACNTGVRK